MMLVDCFKSVYVKIVFLTKVVSYFAVEVSSFKAINVQVSNIFIYFE